MRPHVKAAHVEAADFRFELQHMLNPLGRKSERGAGARLFRVLFAGHEARARPGREIKKDVAPASSDAIHHFPIKRDFHAGTRGLRITHVNVHDGGPCLGRTDASRPLSGVKRTSLVRSLMSANDPKRTSVLRTRTCGLGDLTQRQNN